MFLEKDTLTGQFGENSDAALLTAFAGISSKDSESTGDAEVPLIQ